MDGRPNSANDLERLSGFHQQHERVKMALAEFRKGEKGADIRSVLLPEEFAVVQRSAEVAVENKLNEMLKEVAGQLRDAGMEA